MIDSDDEMLELARWKRRDNEDGLDTCRRGGPRGLHWVQRSSHVEAVLSRVGLYCFKLSFNPRLEHI